MSERGTGGGAALATPRPWRAQGGPQEGVDYIVGPGRDEFLTGPLRRPNAALIVEAVNNYDRLRRIEAAAREYVAVSQRLAVSDDPSAEWLDEYAALHAALTSSQPTPAEPEKEKE